MNTQSTTEHGHCSDVPDIDEIMRVIHEWMTEGDTVIPDEHTDPDLRGMPVHPGYVYRVMGGWQGWSHVQRLAQPDAEISEENRRRDILEDRAWEVLSIVLANQRRRAEAMAANGEIDMDAAREIITGLTS